VVQGNVLVGIYIPAFSYPAALSYQAIINAALDDFGLKEDVCEFFRTENDNKIACIIKNTSMWVGLYHMSHNLPYGVVPVF
jgi:hypothetical protein